MMKRVIVLIGVFLGIGAMAAQVIDVSEPLRSEHLRKMACDAIIYDHFDYDSHMGDNYCGEMMVKQKTLSSKPPQVVTRMMVSVQMPKEKIVCQVVLEKAFGARHANDDGDVTYEQDGWEAKVRQCVSASA